MSRTIAGRVAGASKDSLRRWVLHDPEFAERMAEAEAQSQRVLLRRINNAAAGGEWMAAAWLLERRWPSDYGHREQLDVTLDMDSDVAELAALFGVPPGYIRGLIDSWPPGADA